MDGPRAIDLFLNLWNQQMASEESVRPGTEEYRQHKVHILKNWAQMWEDCVEIEKYIETRENIKENIKNTIEQIKRGEDNEAV